jgi:hypothetical protein
MHGSCHRTTTHAYLLVHEQIPTVGPHREQNKTLECERIVTQLGCQNFGKLPYKSTEWNLHSFMFRSYWELIKKYNVEIFIQFLSCYMFRLLNIGQWKGGIA